MRKRKSNPKETTSKSARPRTGKEKRTVEDQDKREDEEDTELELKPNPAKGRSVQPARGSLETVKSVKFGDKTDLRSSVVSTLDAPLSPVQDEKIIRKLTFNVQDCQTPGRFNLRHKIGEPLQVYLRIRPPLPGEAETYNKVDAGMSEIEANEVFTLDDTTVHLSAPLGSQAYKNGDRIARYMFNRVLKETPQDQVFQICAASVIESFLAGQNGLLFAYGITNSGKTYTMQGSKEQPGIIPRTMKKVFDRLKQAAADSDSAQLPVNESLLDQSVLDYKGPDMSALANDLGTKSVSVSFFEIYNEKIFDLLNTDKERKECKLMMSRNERVFVSGVKQIALKNQDEALAILRQGQRNRTMGGTSLNDNSSRSHSIFTIKLIGKNGDVWSRLSIVDLAGAERSGRSGNATNGDRQREANEINKSLMHLGRCLEILRANQTRAPDKQVQVPYRDSKITRLFKDSLTGWGRTVMITNVSCSPLDFDENLLALKYSSIAREIQINPRVDSNFSARKKSMDKLFDDDDEKSDDEAKPARSKEKDKLVAAKDSEIDSLLDQIYNLKRENVILEERCAKADAEARMEVCTEIEGDKEEWEKQMSQRLESQRVLMEERYERKLKNLQSQLEVAEQRARDVANPPLPQTASQDDSHALRSRMEELESSLASVTESNAALASHLKESDKDKHELSSQLRHALGQSESTTKAHREEVAHLEAKLQEAQDALTRGDLLLQTAQSKVEQLSEQNQALQSVNTEQKTLIDSLLSESVSANTSDPSSGSEPDPKPPATTTISAENISRFIKSRTEKARGAEDSQPKPKRKAPRPRKAKVDDDEEADKENDPGAQHIEGHPDGSLGMDLPNSAYPVARKAPVLPHVSPEVARIITRTKDISASFSTVSPIATKSPPQELSPIALPEEGAKPGRKKKADDDNDNDLILERISIKEEKRVYGKKTTKANAFDQSVIESSPVHSSEKTDEPMWKCGVCLDENTVEQDQCVSCGAQKEEDDAKPKRTARKRKSDGATAKPKGRKKKAVDDEVPEPPKRTLRTRAHRSLDGVS